MAKPPVPANDAFLREVDDELRRDELVAAWRRWGRVGIVALLVALAAFAGWLWWRAHQEQVAGREGEQLQAAYDQAAAGQDRQAQGCAATTATTFSLRAWYRPART
ncbi:hypothetical protein [Sphingomonas bacterium]|uniref:hypothetical protein n=1 Tax=Sphingomonas bacterium TaxID=1895847 RepID=UPI0015770D9A|nr:hypothetical protein [Sphingomonas bacterium]